VLDAPSPRWLIRRVIRRGEMVVLYGEPSAGKTFVAIDIALCIASGFDWWDYSVAQGGVVYLAGEGVGGFGKRVRAWGEGRAVDLRALDMRILPHAVAFMEADEFERLLNTIKAISPAPLLIVVDTLARYMAGGDENSAKEAGLFLDRCGRLAFVTGACVLIIHHKGKGQKSERGSSAIRGAADVMLDVTHANELTTVVGTKAKDAELMRELHLKRRVHLFGLDEDGVMESSLSFERGEPPAVSDEKGAEKEEPAGPPPDHGKTLRGVLARLFNGEAAGGPFFNATGLKKRQHYDALDTEIEEGRIETVGKGENVRYPRYRLTSKAPEYVAPPASPSPSSGESENSDPNSDGVQASQARESESESASTPLGVQRTNSNSRSEGAPKSQPKKKKQQPKRPQPEPQDGDS